MLRGMLRGERGRAGGTHGVDGILCADGVKEMRGGYLRESKYSSLSLPPRPTRWHPRRGPTTTPHSPTPSPPAPGPTLPPPPPPARRPSPGQSSSASGASTPSTVCFFYFPPRPPLTAPDTTLVHHLRDISLLYLSATNRPAHWNPFLAPAPPSSHLSTSPPTSAESESPTASSFVHVPRPHLRRRRPPPATPSDAAPARPAAYLSAADLDGDDAHDQRAWSESHVWWSGVPPDDAAEATSDLEALIASGRLPPADLESAKLVLAYHLHAAGAHDAALARYDTVDWAADSTAGVVHGDAAVADRLRARCLQGLCYELSSTPSPALALQSYLATVSLFQSVTAANPSFDVYREAYRFLATALFRATILSARRPPETGSQTLKILRTFHAYSASWPASFRPVQRQKMLILYLRALYAAPFTPSTLLYPSPASSLSPRQQWEKEVSLALKNGQALLEQSTTFPRAGAVNHPVVLFSQLAIRLYTLLPRSRALSDQVLNLLWWATTLTFQSQSVLRSLVRILADRQEYSDAKRVFELYVGLVLKARQTAQPEISLQLQRRPTDDDAAHPTDIQRQASQAARAVDPPSPATEALVKQATSASYEADGDTDFVPTLLAGAKWLTEGLNEPEEAWRYACLAGDVVQISKLASADTKQLEARVEEVKGIVRMLMARSVSIFFCSISFHPRANNKQRRKPARKSKLPIPIPQPPHILHHHFPYTHIPLPPLTHLRPSAKNPTSDRRYPQESRDGREECGRLASFGCAVDEYGGLGSGENGGRGWVESVGGEG